MWVSKRIASLGRRWQKSEFLIALTLALILIVVAAGLGWENNKIVPINPSPSAHYTLETGNRLSFLSNWDGPIYLSIAENGYQNKGEANFFPLYPLLVRAVHLVVPSLLYSGLIVAWACLVGALYFSLKIFMQLYGLKDNLEALRGTLCFALFPTAIFLLATYTESLFAFLALGAVYFALKRDFMKAALLCAPLTATRLNGLFVLALVSMILLEKRPFKPLQLLVTGAIGSLGFIGYMVYQYVKFQTPLAFVHAQQAHSWVNASGGHLLQEILTLNGVFLLVVAASALYWWPRRKSFALYTLLFVAIVFIGGKNFSGFGRYALMAFPLQFMLYDYLRNKKTGYALALSLSAMLWTFVALRYMGGYSGG